MLKRIAEEENLDRDFYYHNNCCVSFHAKAKDHENRPETADAWSLKRYFNKIARQKLCKYVEDEMVVNRQVLSLATLKHSLSEFLRELYELG